MLTSIQVKINYFRIDCNSYIKYNLNVDKLYVFIFKNERAITIEIFNVVKVGKQNIVCDLHTYNTYKCTILAPEVTASKIITTQTLEHNECYLDKLAVLFFNLDKWKKGFLGYLLQIHHYVTYLPKISG